MDKEQQLTKDLETLAGYLQGALLIISDLKMGMEIDYGKWYEDCYNDLRDIRKRHRGY
jgi:hypothetical protein